MDEERSSPSTERPFLTQTKELKDDSSKEGNSPNETLSRSSMNRNDETMPKKGSEGNEKVGDNKAKHGNQDPMDCINTDLSDQTEEKAVKSSVPERNVLPIDESVIEKLTGGFLQTFLPQAEGSNTVLDELMRNQRVLIETLEQENAKFKESKIMSDLSELMTEAKKYHGKLVHLRKEMLSLHEKSTKLKKRALKLQHHKMKQNLQKEQQKEREMEQEKHLIAKPAAKKTP